MGYPHLAREGGGMIAAIFFLFLKSSASSISLSGARHLARYEEEGAREGGMVRLAAQAGRGGRLTEKPRLLEPPRRAETD